nr:SDR family NAD(P)-dependent oxidoreductase [Haladaptatus sp. R4]
MDSEPVAIVTAAGRGIGEACARRLADDGYTPVLLSKSGAAVDVAEDLGGVGFGGSVTDPDDLDALVTAATERYGRIDALVNNTGHPATATSSTSRTRSGTTGWTRPPERGSNRAARHAGHA